MDMENPIKLETPTKEAFQLDTPSVGNGNGVVDADNDQANNNDASNNNDDFNGGNNENGNGPNSNADYSHNNEDENDCSQVNEDNNENGESSTHKRQASDFGDNQQQNNNFQKRQKTGGMNQNQNRQFQRKEGGIEMRILLPSKDAGAIIGRGGANIKKLRQEHKTQIQVPDCNGPERLLLISGDLDTCIKALLDVIPLLEDNQKFSNDGGGATELRLLVHQSQAGCIIGRGGDKIKELRIKHNLDMKVYSECAPMSTERVCQMKGKSPDIVQCLREAIALLETAPPKGMSRPYDPHNFDEFLASQYGGFCNDKRQGGMQGGRGGGQHNFGNRGGGGGFNNDGGNRGFNRNNSGDGGNGFNHNNNNNGYNDQRGGRGGLMDQRGGGGGGRGGFSDRGGRGGFNDRGAGGRGGFGGGSGGGRGGFSDRGGDRVGRGGGYNNNSGGGNQGYNNNNNSHQAPVGNAPPPGGQTNQVTIPNELAGAVIGPKGAKIQQIRDQSGAGITIDKPTPGSTDRIITIQGTPEQIQNAQYLLQVTVKQSGLWQGQ